MKGVVEAHNKEKKKREGERTNAHFATYIADSNRQMAQMMAQEFDKSLQKLAQENKKLAQSFMDHAEMVKNRQGIYADAKYDDKEKLADKLNEILSRTTLKDGEYIPYNILETKIM